MRCSEEHAAGTTARIVKGGSRMTERGRGYQKHAGRRAAARRQPEKSGSAGSHWRRFIGARRFRHGCDAAHTWRAYRPCLQPSSSCRAECGGLRQLTKPGAAAIVAIGHDASVFIASAGRRTGSRVCANAIRVVKGLCARPQTAARRVAPDACLRVNSGLRMSGSRSARGGTHDR